MPTSATGDQSYIAIMKQNPLTPKVVPENPVMQKVNFADEDLKRTNKTSKSPHVRDDRMNSGLTIQGFDIGGGYNYSLTYENSLLDELLAAFLWSVAWSHIGATAVVDAEGGTITLAGGVLDMTGASEKLTNIVDGQKIMLTDTANSGANDGVYTLTETGTDTYSMLPLPDADETLGVGATMTGSMIRNGKTYQPFFIERGHVDVQKYFKFVGMGCNVLSLAFPDQEDVKGTYQFIGLNSSLDDIVEDGATYTPINSNSIMSTGNNTGRISIDGVLQEGCYVKEHDLQLDNKLTAKTGQGVYGACETKAHSIELTGSITTFFENSGMYNRFINGVPFSLDWDVIDSAGHGYSYSLPRLQIETDETNVTGMDDDVMENATYAASYSDVTECMFQIDRF